MNLLWSSFLHCLLQRIQITFKFSKILILGILYQQMEDYVLLCLKTLPNHITLSRLNCIWHLIFVLLPVYFIFPCLSNNSPKITLQLPHKFVAKKKKSTENEISLSLIFSFFLHVSDSWIHWCLVYSSICLLCKPDSCFPWLAKIISRNQRFLQVGTDPIKVGGLGQVQFLGILFHND